MTVPRRARELIIVAVLLALPLLLLRKSLHAPGQLNLFDRGLLRLAAPLEAALVGAAHAVGHSWQRYVALWSVSDENQHLRRENANLRSEIIGMQQAVAHASELERLLDVRRGIATPSLAAHVIGAQTSAFFQVVRLRLDRGDGEVRIGMPVVAAAGIVGRIERSFGRYSDVLLAIDPKSAIDVLITSSDSKQQRGRGLLRGMPGTRGYRARIDYLLRQDEISVGDRVVTSGLGGFPRFSPIGVVTKVTRQSFGLYQEAEVAPSVDFSKLNEVLVVQSPELDEKVDAP